MARKLTKKRHVPIIEVSDSDDEENVKIVVEPSEVEKPELKQTIKKRKLRSDKVIERIEGTKKVNAKEQNQSKTSRKITVDLSETDEPESAQTVKKRKLQSDDTTEGIGRNKKGKLERQRKVAKSTPKKRSNEADSRDQIQQSSLLTSDYNSQIQCTEWTDIDYVCEAHNLNKHTVENISKLFNEDNTIPFIARYRKNVTGDMEAEQLRAIKESFDRAKEIQHRAATIIKVIDKAGKWTPEVHVAVKSAKSLHDLEHIYSLFKPASKKSLAERARDLGLDSISTAVLKGETLPDFSSIVKPKQEGLKTEKEIKEGIVHIISDVISKDKSVFDKVKELQEKSFIEIQVTQSKSAKTLKQKNENMDINKYENYFNFKMGRRNIKPHQILAINRGEAQKILNVKLEISDSLENEFRTHCLKRFTSGKALSKLHLTLINDSIEYAYKKVIKPMIIRRVRSDMREEAETASIAVFIANVKQLLLTPPVRGKTVLGIDPGFSHGCKLAVISPHGNVLDTAVIYPHKNFKNSVQYKDKSRDTLIDLVGKYNVSILALGNATACRETELFLTELIQSKAFGSKDVSYIIINEAGASIYSCSTEAKTEFPNTDPNIVSAISIARRLQDPLAELVKVEPKHLGVGMYQHDVSEKRLSIALDEVVSEAVSFVGVDVNTASHCLLKRVAGLNVSKATNIIVHRNTHGPFQTREQVLNVKGIGKKTFEQCAGFIRILPETSAKGNDADADKASRQRNSSINLLDQTWIHPESYEIAEKFLKYCNCNLEDLGQPGFIRKIKSYEKEGYEYLAEKFNTNERTMEIIIKGLSMKKDEDIRSKSSVPLFRKGLLTINDLDVGTQLSGAVRNVTHFGAFVDIGVGRDALIHSARMRNNQLAVGQSVEVRVIHIDRERGRINLEIVRAL